jgi:hypothetical protein
MDQKDQEQSEEYLFNKLTMDEFQFRSWRYGEYIKRESEKQRADPNYDSPLNYE